MTDISSGTQITTPPQSIVFTGRLGSFLGVAIVNLLLAIVTVGIYRFWGKTRIRRYLFEHTRFASEPLEYRGRGLELLIGALLALVIIILPAFVFSLFEGFLRAGGHIVIAALLQLVLLIGILYLIGVGFYRSERYLLSRTSWRGIRGGMTGQGWSYGWLYLKLGLLRVVTLGFASPYVATRLWNTRMSEAMFGSARVVAKARWRPLFGRFVVALIVSLVIYAVAIAVLVGMSMQFAGMIKPGAPPPRDLHLLLPLLVRLYAVLLVAAFLVVLVMLSYHAAYWREIVGATRLDTMGFSFSATTGAWLGFYLGNVLIVVLTLGLGLIVIPLRTWGFYMRHLQTVGAIDIDAVQQTTLAAPTQGDGIADALGVSLLPF